MCYVVASDRTLIRQQTNQLNLSKCYHRYNQILSPLYFYCPLKDTNIPFNCSKQANKQHQDISKLTEMEQ